MSFLNFFNSVTDHDVIYIEAIEAIKKGNQTKFRKLLKGKNLNIKYIDYAFDDKVDFRLKCLEKVYDPDDIKFLISQGADFSNCETLSPINAPASFFALVAGQFDTFIYLDKTYNFDINKTDAHGQSILHACATWTNTKSLNHILSRGIDVNLTNKQNQNALYYINDHWACHKDSLKSFCQLLLSYDINVEALDINGLNPIENAIRTERYLVAAELLRTSFELNKVDLSKSQNIELFSQLTETVLNNLQSNVNNDSYYKELFTELSVFKDKLNIDKLIQKVNKSNINKTM